MSYYQKYLKYKKKYLGMKGGANKQLVSEIKLKEREYIELNKSLGELYEGADHSDSYVKSEMERLRKKIEKVEEEIRALKAQLVSA